jgi:pimeloyl-ACP methyl ester carboxylesterase
MVMTLVQLRAPLGPSDPVLIFVHGILSDSTACWLNGDQVTWPEIVQRDKALSVCGVSTFSYATSVTGTRFSITDAANSLWAQLQDKNMLSADRPLIFVCHSMGGIVVRKLLVRQQSELERKGVGLIGLVLVASPSMGSRWATWLLPLSLFLRHVQAMALSSSESNTWLHELREDFVKLRDNGPVKIFGKELIEAEPIALKWVPWLPPIVRSIEGGVLFADSQKIAGTDHFTVAKPAHEAADQHVALRNFVKEFRRRSSGGSYTIPGGTSFAQGAQLIAGSRSMDVDLMAFTDGERGIQATADRLIGFTTMEEAFENLIVAFPAGSIRKYGVEIQQTTVILVLKEVAS